MGAQAVTLRLRAERRIGQIMDDQRKTGLLKQGGDKKSKAARESLIKPPTLAEVGIDKNLAHKARTLGALSDEQFEEVVQETRQAVSRAVSNVVRAKTIENEREAYDASKDQGGTIEDLTALGALGFQAGVIYADPPWSFEAYSVKGKQRSAERYYDTMSLADLCAMRPAIDAIAAPDCALLMWGVWPELPGALEVIEAWGFTYKTAGFVWVKTNADETPATGMGYWSRANTEPCFLATRGNPKRLAMDVHQVAMAPRGEHSAKPDEVRTRIERLLPGPYIELFARAPVAGWTTWGNEVP